MLIKNFDAKVRPLSASSGLDKTSLIGAARIYVSKETLYALTNGENGKRCAVEKLDDSQRRRREATLWMLPEKNLSPNVVNMTRAFLEAAELTLGDQVRISLLDGMPDVEEVVLEEVNDDSNESVNEKDMKYPLWTALLMLYMSRVDLVFPGMILENVGVDKLRRSFRIISINGHTNNVARYRMASSDIRIVNPHDEVQEPPKTDSFSGELAVTGVTGLAPQVLAINEALQSFTRPFLVRNECRSCGLVIQGSRGTGKTFMLQRIADANWGRPYWIKPSDKLATLREVLKQAQTTRPSVVLMDDIDKLFAKERPNRDAVIEAVAEHLDALSREAHENQALPKVVIVATCQDYIDDVPEELQNYCRFEEHFTLPIPRTDQRLEILKSLDLPLHPDSKAKCLERTAKGTHAYTVRDLILLALKANRALGRRLAKQAPESISLPMLDSDLEQAMAATKASTMQNVKLCPPTVYWQDVGGQDDLKKELQNMIEDMTLFHTPGEPVFVSQPPKGILLYGPPGCSKTLLAQATATESGYNFFAVKGAELLNMYVGESERAVRALFARARAASPSIIFFDEIDSIGSQREPSKSTASGVNVLTSLLTEMDGFEVLRGVLILAATNRPEAMDPALMRPGRFDQVLYVGPPDLAAREAIFNVHLRKITTTPDVNIQFLAAESEGYSGADIQAICNSAGKSAQSRFKQYGNFVMKGVTMRDLRDALKRTRPTITNTMNRNYELWLEQYKR